MEYRCCVRCVMDTTDPEIEFDTEGVCSHCYHFDAMKGEVWFPGELGAGRLHGLIERIKRAGKGREYDSILGLSGGVDSSFLALRAKDWGLRPLVVHVDAGWNSELAVANIEAVVKHCGYDLHTHVVDWSEMRDLQLAYLRSGISNQDVPQDHAFFAALYHFATRNNIKYILSGGNFATEGVFPASWQWSAMDAINLRDIHRKHGTLPLRRYETISFTDYYLWYPFVKRMRTLRPLNYMSYIKSEALEELQSRVGYKPYARKHGESVFTKLFQNYYQPARFGFDKRRPHLSSVILSGQLSRADALRKLEEPLYDADELELDISYFCKKLRIERAEFDALMRAPVRSASEYKSWTRRHSVLKKAQEIAARLLGRRLRVYS